MSDRQWWYENITSFDYDGMRRTVHRCFCLLILIGNLTICSSFMLQIWVRNYQVLEQQASNALEAHLAKNQSGQNQTTSLVEIGPRFVLNPIRIFRGSFGGQTLHQNPDFVSPNVVRALERHNKGSAYVDRKDQQKKRKVRKEELVLPEDPLDSVFR